MIRLRETSIWSVLPLLPVVLGIAGGVIVLLDTAPIEGASPVVESGRALYSVQCAGCHGSAGGGIEGRGPTLLVEGEAATDFVLRTGRMPLAAPDIQAQRGPVRYSEEEIVALVAYVGSIGSGPEIPSVDIATADVTNGGDLYRLNCAACHVASGAGAPVGGGRNAPNVLEATPTQVAEAIIVGPGSMPVFGSFTQSDLDDVAAYVDRLAEQRTTGARDFGGAGPAAEGLAAWLLALVPMIALTRWIGSPKEGRDRAIDDRAPDPAEVEA